MTEVENTFAGSERVTIFWRAWLPDRSPLAAVVIAHGVAEHSGRYAHVGARLAESGYAAYALDHRGHGRSGGVRAMLDRMDNVVVDLRAFIALVRERHDGLPVFLLGHSMGGAISLEYALRHDGLDGLALSGAATALESASPTTRVVARILATVTPRLGLLKLDSSKISTDPEVVRAYDDDPLVFRGKLPARTISELAGSIVAFPPRLPRLVLPVLVMHGGADALVPVLASARVHAEAGATDKTLKVYDGLAHEILNEPDRERVIGDLVAWLDERAHGEAHKGGNRRP